MKNEKAVRNFKDFWLIYVMAHQDKRNRWFHFAASISAILSGILFALTREIAFLVSMPVISYALAWIGHLFFEKNKPLTWTYPVWSLIAEQKLFLMMLLNRMDREVERVQSQQSLYV